MKQGQLVHQVFQPDNVGTVSATRADGSVRVTWPRRQSQQGEKFITLPRMRVWYSKERAVLMLVPHFSAYV